MASSADLQLITAGLVCVMAEPEVAAVPLIAAADDPPVSATEAADAPINAGLAPVIAGQEEATIEASASSSLDVIPTESATADLLDAAVHASQSLGESDESAVPAPLAADLLHKQSLPCLDETAGARTEASLYIVPGSTPAASPGATQAEQPQPQLPQSAEPAPPADALRVLSDDLSSEEQPLFCETLPADTAAAATPSPDTSLPAAAATDASSPLDAVAPAAAPTQSDTSAPPAGLPIAPEILSSAPAVPRHRLMLLAADEALLAGRRSSGGGAAAPPASSATAATGAAQPPSPPPPLHSVPSLFGLSQADIAGAPALPRSVALPSPPRPTGGGGRSEAAGQPPPPPAYSIDRTPPGMFLLLVSSQVSSGRREGAPPVDQLPLPPSPASL